LIFSIVISFLVAYLLGNLNGAVCVSALVAHDDVRSHGSGNAGLTNFIRNYGTASAFLVIAIDAGKAAVACWSCGMMLQPYGWGFEGMVLGGVCVILGHCFPALLGFKGGKGILSGAVVALVIDWRIGLIILAVFALIYGLTKYVSLASVLSAAAFGICFVAFHHDWLPVMLGGIFMSGLTIFMHRGNIARLIKGTESKTDLFKRKGTKQ
jgi:glycerol-3-phosphate acyltransferase PlsY